MNVLCFWRWNSQFLLFINYIIVTDVIVTGPGVIEPLFFIAVIMVHGVIMEPCECQGSPWP